MPEFPNSFLAIAAERVGVAPRMTLRKKQLGSPGRKDYSRKGRKISRLLNPWGGPNIPMRFRKAASPSGSSRRQSKSAPELAPQTRGYPRNQPSQWPVEVDTVNHTTPPPLSGYVDDVADAHNAAVENAYTRAGYQ